MTESGWDEQQRGWVLALAQTRALTCAGCGGWLPETIPTDAEDYTVPPPSRCGACDAIAIEQEARKNTARPYLTRWSAERRRDG